MKKALTSVLLALTILAVPATTFAATTKAKAPVKAATVARKTAKKVAIVSKTKAKVNMATCARCKSFAEGVDTTSAAKADHWVGTVIGINEGAHGIIITEASALNHIKAFQQRYVDIGDDTVIETSSGDEKTFAQMDIGYKIDVKGTYDSKKRVIDASAIEIIKMPEAPVGHTK